MKIGLRAGHSPNCLGARGIVDEHYSMKDYYSYIKDILEKYGHTVVDCNSNANTQGDELWEGANIANGNNVDLFISLHMNSFNGNANGTEAWTYGETSRANSYARNLVDNFSKLGFYNRGVKYNSKYTEMRSVNAPNIIFETCFCDSPKDIAVYNQYSWEQLAYAFCNAIDSNIPFAPPTPIVEAPKQSTIHYYVITNYLHADDKNYTNMEPIMPIFDGVRFYIRRNETGVWIETQYLSLEKCNELKEKLESINLFWDIKQE